MSIPSNRQRANLRQIERQNLNPDILERRKKAVRKHNRKKRNIIGVPPDPPDGFPCEMCGRSSQKSLCADHDHRTNRFRGWLCSNCNAGIAMLGDNVKGVTNALIYLNKYYG